MAFHEVLLPTDMDYGVTGGPGFQTGEVPLFSGHVRRNEDWEEELGQWTVIYTLLDTDEIDVLKAFWRNRKGKVHGFRLKDPLDFALDRQSIGTTDGSTSTFQVYKRWTSLTDYDNNIYKILSGATSCWVNNVSITEGAGASEFSVNINTGIITLGSTLAAQSGTDVEVALTEYHRPVRFAVDKPSMVQSFHDRFDWTVDIVETRDIV